MQIKWLFFSPSLSISFTRSLEFKSVFMFALITASRHFSGTADAADEMNTLQCGIFQKWRFEWATHIWLN